MVFPWTKRIDCKEKLLSYIIYKIRTIKEWFLFFFYWKWTISIGFNPHIIKPLFHITSRLIIIFIWEKTKKKKIEKKELNIMGYKFIIHLSYTFLGQVISIRLIFFSPYSYINHKIWCRKHLSNYIIWPIISSLLSNNIQTFE